MRRVVLAALLLVSGGALLAESRPVNEGAPDSYKSKVRKSKKYRPKKYKAPKKFKAAKHKKPSKAKYGARQRRVN